ncbi:MAG: hypothetical protein GXN91_02405 [Epsilonproteobacteria bacterium]|nr:hypothetical protein [Campylobacterota bacterium]
MDNLRDIRGFIEISDYSFWLFISTLIVGLILGIIFFKKGFEYAKSRCKIDCQRYFLYRFKNVDWSNPKKAAYEATYYGRFLATDKRRMELFKQLKQRLAKYKYQKEIKEIDKETLNYYNLYKQVCDESI